MAETIEYNSIVKFINDDIINNKIKLALSSLSGGASTYYAMTPQQQINLDQAQLNRTEIINPPRDRVISPGEVLYNDSKVKQQEQSAASSSRTAPASSRTAPASSRTGPASVTVTFNQSSGKIEITNNTSGKQVLAYSVMINIMANDISYEINNTLVNSMTYINSKPVETALVIAYLSSPNRKINTVSGVKSDEGYTYKFEDDGSLTLYSDKEGKNVVDTITVANRQYMSGENKYKETAKNACGVLFGFAEGLTNNTCSAHFYNILGKSALGMLKNMGASVDTTNIVDSLKTANVGIKYEILKNLDWKMKISNGKKEMVSVDQWLERLEKDDRDFIKTQAGEFRKYLNNNSKVKDILQSMIDDINNNSRLLDDKYKEAVTTNTGNLKPSKNRKRLLTPLDIARLQSESYTSNVLLNQPYMGLNGVMFAPNMKSPFQSGGSKTKHELSYDAIKHNLESIGQKLSSDTDRQVMTKINKIKILEEELAAIHTKINNYTEILRKNKQYILNGQVLTFDVIDDLLNQYNTGTKKQTKEMVTLYSAFGKIKMLLEKGNSDDENPNPKREPYFSI